MSTKVSRLSWSKALLIGAETYHFSGSGSTDGPCGKAAEAASLVAGRIE